MTKNTSTDHVIMKDQDPVQPAHDSTDILVAELFRVLTRIVESPSCNEDISFETILHQFIEYNLISPYDNLTKVLVQSFVRDKADGQYPLEEEQVTSPRLCNSTIKATSKRSTDVEEKDGVYGSTNAYAKVTRSLLQDGSLLSVESDAPRRTHRTQSDFNGVILHPSKTGHEIRDEDGSETNVREASLLGRAGLSQPTLNKAIDFNPDNVKELAGTENYLPPVDGTNRPNDELLWVRGSRVTTSRDNWVVDPMTAALINYNNREQCTSDVQPAQLIIQDTDTVKRGAVLPNDMSSWNPQLEDANDFQAAQQYAAQQPLTKTHLSSLHTLTHLRQRVGRLTSKQALLHRLLAEQDKKRGMSEQWSSPMALALVSCSDPDIVDTIRVIASTLTLRDMFIYDYGEIPSLCIFQKKTPQHLGEESTEPIMDVLRVAPLPPCDAEYRMEDGVFRVYWNPNKNEILPAYLSKKYGGAPLPFYNGKPLLSWRRPVPSAEAFLTALRYVMDATQHPGCKTFAFRRLVYLRNCYNMHQMFNAELELQEVKENTHRDFYNVRKVDTHVHHSACMHQKHLLRFIRKKYRTEPNQIVARSRDGAPLTLRHIFDSEVGTTAWEASVDLLNVHALGSCFHRFDKFNSKYNPFGQVLLREVFLKTDNMIQGRYLAEMTREVIADLEDGKYQFVEWRVSIYGKSYDEWKKLSEWICNNNLISKQVRWMIQVPRLFHLYRKLNLITSFADLLHNIFSPLFEAVRNPEAHPEIYRVLLQMNGWDSVDDESIVSKYTSGGSSLPHPAQWTEATNPPYSYWAYYMYANIQNLNQFLVARGLRPLPFRPHCGEAGSISHLASMFLLADKINHGIMLRKSPLLQYLYYLRQIGLSVSPLSNNALFHRIEKNPFYDYFTIGMNVALSSDDPLMFHFTDEALLEEYSCCAHVWRLSPVDLCEIARNSVLQSYFEPQLKKHWLGEHYHIPGKKGNDLSRTNVANVRLGFRHDTLMKEWRYLRNVLHMDKYFDETLLKAGNPHNSSPLV